MSALPVVVVFLLLACSAQDGQEREKPYQPKQKIDFKLSIVEDAGTWRFVAEGTTDLPEDVQLRARIYALDEVDDYKGGKRIEEYDLSVKDHDFVPKGGRFKEPIFEGPRRPFSLTYRVYLYYDPFAQAVPVRNKVLDQVPFDVHVDFRRGTAAELEAELEASRQEIAGELIDRIKQIFRDLKSAFAGQQKKFDGPAWDALLKEWQPRVKVVAASNALRWSIWPAWVERKGKYYIEGFCDNLENLADQCTDALNGNRNAMAVIARGFESFQTALEEALEALGVDAPFDSDEVVARLAPYVESFAGIRKLIEESDKTGWARESDGLRSTARASLLELSQQKLVARRGYERVVAISDLFLRIDDLAKVVMAGTPANGEAAKMKELLKEHDQKLKEFKDYAEKKVSRPQQNR